MKAICTILSEYSIGRGLYVDDDSITGKTNKFISDTVSKGLDYITPKASTIAGLPGRATYGIANTTTGGIALASLAGLGAARYLAKKYQEKNTRDNQSNPTVSQKPEKKQVTKLGWEKGGIKTEQTNLLDEQNENLPRFPMLSYTNTIKPNPRAITTVFQDQPKLNNYDTNAENDNIETSRKIAAKNIKRRAAETSVDKVIGKLVA